MDQQKSLFQLQTKMVERKFDNEAAQKPHSPNFIFLKTKLWVKNGSYDDPRLNNTNVVTWKTTRLLAET